MGESSTTSRSITVEIVNRLADDGLDPHSYQLANYVDLPDLKQMVASGDPTEAITFRVEGRTVTVSGTGVIAVRS